MWENEGRGRNKREEEEVGCMLCVRAATVMCLCGLDECGVMRCAKARVVRASA